MAAGEKHRRPSSKSYKHVIDGKISKDDIKEASERASNQNLEFQFQHRRFRDDIPGASASKVYYE
jgi:hypothetical protein